MPIAPEITCKKKNMQFKKVIRPLHQKILSYQKGYTLIALTILKSKYDEILCTVHF